MRYLALLRGINVGGRVIRMADLKACFEELEFRNVQTILQTGNVLFDWAEKHEKELKKRIENALTLNFGYAAKAQVLSSPRLKQIIEACPFSDSDAKHVYVVFFENGLEKDIESDAELSPDEAIERGEGVIYWNVEKGQTLKTGFAKQLTKSKYKDFNTNRNLKTLARILAKI